MSSCNSSVDHCLEAQWGEMVLLQSGKDFRIQFGWSAVMRGGSGSDDGDDGACGGGGGAFGPG